MGWMRKAERVAEIWKVKSSWEGVGRRRKSRNCLRELAKAIVTLSWLVAVVRSHRNALILVHGFMAKVISFERDLSRNDDVEEDYVTTSLGYPTYLLCPIIRSLKTECGTNRRCQWCINGSDSNLSTFSVL